MNQAVKIVVLEIPDIELRLLCATFLDAAMAFYEDENNRQRFEQWLAGQKGGANGQEDGCKAAAGLSEPFAG